MPCEVDDREEQVAELLQQARMITFGVELGKLLVDLGPGTAGVRPVETDASGAALQLGCPFECRKSQRNAC